MNEISHAYFIALLPTGELNDKILDAKLTVKQRVGDQQYLSDPPHSTLYLSHFRHPLDLLNVIERLSQKISSPSIEIEGWGIFENDCLTGNSTLYCRIKEEAKQSLRSIQLAILQAVSGGRDVQESENRYRSSWTSLSEDRRRAVREFGFPFVGHDWQPHLTIASVRSDDWGTVWDALKNRPIEGVFNTFQLAVFSLMNNDPELLQIYPLS